MTAVIVFPGNRRRDKAPSAPFFDRREWLRLMDLYGRMVAAGQWCDYGLEQGSERIAFLVFRGQRSVPAFRIVKAMDADQGGERRRPFFLLLAPDGRLLRRSRSLATLLAPFERRLLRLWQRDALPS